MYLINLSGIFTVLIFGAVANLHEDPGDLEAAFNPLERALVELRDAYIKEERIDLCGADSAIHAECGVCLALGATSRDSLCCLDLDEFIRCHIRVMEFFDDMSDIENNVIDAPNSHLPYDYNSKTNTMKKRYGTVFSKWNWFGGRNDNKREKRYGTLFGRIGKREENFQKRYGQVMGNLPKNTFENFRKRYGMLFGGPKFSKNITKDKRYMEKVMET